MTMKNGPPDAPRGYVLGHSERELERLQTQARLIDPITRRFFGEAGIVTGMRVLDVGSGAGDVAFLAADMVGAVGEVVGVDRVAGALDVARARASDRGHRHVHFFDGDPGEMQFERMFDAVIGRYVLQFQRDPALMLRRLARHVRPGGLIVFHEIDWAGVGSHPTAPLYEQCGRWGAETLRLHGTETRMGMTLHSAFVNAGLAAPSLRLEALVGGGTNSRSILFLMTELVATLLPQMERLGVATAADVGLDDLFERMLAEVTANSSAVSGHFQVGAWCRTDAE